MVSWGNRKVPDVGLKSIPFHYFPVPVTGLGMDGWRDRLEPSRSSESIRDGGSLHGFPRSWAETVTLHRGWNPSLFPRPSQAARLGC